MRLKNICMPLLAALAIGFSTTGCNNNENKNDEQTILKPISQYLVGKWRGEASYEQDEKGEWIKEEEAYDPMLTFRADGTARFVYIYEDGREKFILLKWEGDDANNRFLIDGKEVKLLCLTGDRFENWGNGKRDVDTGEMVEYSKHKWTHVRTDDSDLTFSERLLGKWVYSASYEKVDGKWQETDFGAPEASYNIFKESGDMAAYVRFSSKEYTMDAKWSVNGKTKELKTEYSNGEVRTQKIEISEDGTQLTVYYGSNTSPSGETRNGEFKDVMTRVVDSEKPTE